jgi:integrase
MVFVLALFCGMRRSEIDRLRWEQVDFVKRHIWIRTTSDKRPKALNSEARIDAGDEVFDALKSFQSHSVTPPYVIPGSLHPTVRYRCHDTYRRLIPWLQSKGLPKLRTLHALRKEAGSIIYQQSGSVDVAADFLRNDPRVAREHYIGRKGRLELVLPSPTPFPAAMKPQAA